MNHKPVGFAEIGQNTTTIRKYENGMYSVEVNGDVKYSSRSLKELEEKLDDDGVSYSVTDRT